MARKLVGLMAEVPRLGALLLTCAFAAGCDPFPGPRVQNGYATDISVHVTYDDGTSNWTIWPPCRTVHLGAPHARVARVVIEADGRIAQEFSYEDIRHLIDDAKGDRTGLLAWVVDSTGIHLAPRDSCAERTPR